MCPSAGLLVLLLFVCTPNACAAAEKSAAILLSREIAPYVEMVSGFEAALGNQPVKRFFLDEQGQPFTLSGHESILVPENFSALVAVGPEALRLLQSRQSLATPLFFGMVLRPSVRALETPPICGVELSLPIDQQFAALQQKLPSLKRLGILFDPENNQTWFDDAQLFALQLNMELLPIQVQRTNGRLELVGDFTKPDALMFIPDKSIISQAVIQYVIKQAILQHMPVIGYNQFFLDSGAALAFVIDYRQIGSQVAQQVETVLAGQDCPSMAPVFELRSNLQVWRALGLPQGRGVQP